MYSTKKNSIIYVLEEKYSPLNATENVGCYFCYDPEATDSGPLIQPCECRGDVATVHHECLRKWLLTVSFL